MTENAERPSILVVVPPPIWALLFFIAAWIAGRAFGLPVRFQYPWIGLAVFFAGLLISASGRFAFARAGTEVVPVSAKNSVLVTTGPFRFTRNPMYLGILVATAGLSLVLGTVAALFFPVVFFLFANFISIPYEEKKMTRQFGDAYRDYKARVRRWI